MNPAARFLSLLDENAERFTFQTATDAEPGDKPQPDPLAGHVNLSPDDLTMLVRRNADRRAAVWVCVNETDGRGRKRENVTRVRAVFLDGDGQVSLDQLLSFTLTPHIVVESSPGHYQAYWLVDGLAREQFEGVQRRIAKTFGDADSIVDLCRVMRVPGFLHQKDLARPFEVRIAHENTRLPYKPADVLRTFPPLNEGPKPNGASGSHNDALPPYPSQAQVESLLQDQTAADYWDQRFNVTPASDRSPSGWDLAFAGHLARTGMCRTDIAAYLRAYRHHHEAQKLKQDRSDYVWETVDRALSDADDDETFSKIDGEAPPKADLSSLYLTPKQWAARQIPPQDLLLGSVFSTTTRTQLVADTGLGKTMTGLGISFGIRLGRDFLGWRGHREAKVLYLDGEMPAELIKERLELAHSWFHVAEPIDAGFWLLSREDLEDIPPLDRPEAKDWLLDLIDQLGGVDHITFDNIGALTGADLKEEDGARVLKELQRELTKRKIGQLWLHHTGHDSSRGYGSKMREWHLDTVMMAEKLEAADADVSITLKFPKSRRRTPNNRSDYGPFEIVLRDGAWSMTHTTCGTSARGPGKRARLCLDALKKALDEVGTLPPYCSATAGVRTVVTIDQWSDFFDRMAPYALADPTSAKRKAWNAGVEELAANHTIGKWDKWVWITQRP